MTISQNATAIADVPAREARHILQVYRRMPVTFVRGEGVRLFDANGREYLDLLSGVGVASLGHAHPILARAIAEQAQTLIHTSNLFYHPLQALLAEELAALSGLPRAFFCNSGTEAVEACLKFARRYWHTRGEPRAEFVALEESFHGRTFGSLSVTSESTIGSRSSRSCPSSVSCRAEIRPRCWRRSRERPPQSSQSLSRARAAFGRSRARSPTP